MADLYEALRPHVEEAATRAAAAIAADEQAAREEAEAAAARGKQISLTLMGLPNVVRAVLILGGSACSLCVLSEFCFVWFGLEFDIQSSLYRVSILQSKYLFVGKLLMNCVSHWPACGCGTCRSNTC